MLSRLDREQTGGAMTAFLVVLWAFVGLTALGLTVMGIFLTHVRAMNAADAAAEGALLALRQPITEAMTARSAANLTAFWEDVNQQVWERVDDWEDSYRSLRQAELEGQIPPLDPEVIAQILREEIAERRPAVTSAYWEGILRDRKPAIAAHLLRGTLPLLDRLQHFLSAEEVGCIARQATETHHGRAVEWAGEFARANGAIAPRNQDVRFATTGELRVSVWVPYRVNYFVLDEYVGVGHRYLTGQAEHQLRSVAGIPVRVSACP